MRFCRLNSSGVLRGNLCSSPGTETRLGGTSGTEILAKYRCDVEPGPASPCHPAGALEGVSVSWSPERRGQCRQRPPRRGSLGTVPPTPPAPVALCRGDHVLRVLWRGGLLPGGRRTEGTLTPRWCLQQG